MMLRIQPDVKPRILAHPLHGSEYKRGYVNFTRKQGLHGFLHREFLCRIRAFSGPFHPQPERSCRIRAVWRSEGIEKAPATHQGLNVGKRAMDQSARLNKRKPRDLPR